ncbi:MAG: hypothetical protein S4CHLAM20_04570 [Chlamydiia bacterium]|nr:hypothetical protein [Chlamydiia bacterium]
MSWEKIISDLSIVRPETIDSSILAQAIQLDFYKSVCREAEQYEKAFYLKEEMEIQFAESYKMLSNGLKKRNEKEVREYKSSLLVHNISNKLFIILNRRFSQSKLWEMEIEDLTFYRANSFREIKGMTKGVMEELLNLVKREGFQWKD